MSLRLITIQQPDGRWVGVDMSSGGYPYPVRSIRQAELWMSESQATDYLRYCEPGSRVVEYELTEVNG